MTLLKVVIFINQKNIKMTYNRKNHEQCFSPMILTTYIVLLVFVKKLSDFEKFYEFGVFKKNDMKI